MDGPDLSEPQPDGATVPQDYLDMGEYFRPPLHRLLTELSNSTNSTGGLTPAAVAGISIGGAILGLLLLVGLYYLCTRRKQEDMPRSYSGYAPTPQYQLPPASGPQTIFANLEFSPGGDADAWNDSRTRRGDDVDGMPLLALRRERGGR